MKKFLSTFLAIIFVFSAVPMSGVADLVENIDFSFLSVKSSAASESDLTFKLNSDGNSYSVKKKSSSISGNLVIPSTYNGKSVTSIGDDAFEYCRSLTSITIPNSVTSIGDDAFNSCSNLTSITIPNSVTCIGEYAFYKCSYLESVTIGNSVTSIGDDAFGYCDSLTSITIPDGVTSIGYGTFQKCYKLKNVVMGNNVTVIGSSAFRSCSFTSINLSKSLTSIGDFAFGNCNLSTVKIPNSVTKIGKNAFVNCCYLATVTIPNSVTKIGYDAFSGCYELSSVTYIGSSEQWSKISIGSGNEYLTGANITYHSHNYYVSSFKDATCTENGYKVTRCDSCDYEHTDIIPAGHQNECYVTPATTEVNGQIVTKCKICLAVLNTEIIYRPASITLSTEKYTYNGSAKKPSVKVYDSNKKEIDKKYFTVTYSNNVNPGTATVTVNFKDNYSGTMTKNYTIVKGTQKISAANKSVAVGKTVSIGAKLTAGNGTLTYSSSNKKIATISKDGKITAKIPGSVTISVTANATSTYDKATTKVTVKVIPAGTAISSITAKQRGMIVKWKKQATQTSGYQIRYSKKSDMSGAKTVTISNNGTVSKTITGLTGLAKYYVQIRTYKKGSSTNYYSAWSGTKTVKTQGKPYLNLSGTTIYVGKQVKLKLNEANGKVTWTSSNSAVATVNSNGVVTGKKAGTVTITAKNGSQKFTSKITVKKPVYGMVKGTVLYHYNSNFGYIADAGSNVYILDTINNEIVAHTCIDGSGNFSVKVPTGKYQILILSANTNSVSVLNDESSRDYYYDNYGIYILAEARYRTSITVSKGETTYVSHRFGYSDF